MQEFVNVETYTAYWIKRSEMTTTAFMNLRSKLSTVDFTGQNETEVAIFTVEQAGLPTYVVVPKIRKNLLEFIIGKRLMFEKSEYEHEVVKYETPKFEPKDFQKEIIEGVLQIWNDKFVSDTRCVIALPPGTGKSFTSASLVYRTGCKFIFLVYSGKLIKQTYDSFCFHLGKKGMLVLERGSDFEDIDWSKVKGLFMTHRMMYNLLKEYGYEYVADVLENKMGCSMSVYDEFDKEVKNLYKLDCFTNFKFNLRLTGTAYKSLKVDDSIFQNIYRHAHIFGKDVRLKSNKKMLLVHWKFNPTQKEASKMKLYDEKLFKTYYNDLLARKDMFIDYVMYQFWMKDGSILKKALVEENGQCAIYCGRIENCEIVKDKLVKRYGISEDDIGIYNSSISEGEKKKAENKRWILTTCSSLGRGYDNPNIRALIFMEFSFSASEAEQSWNRTARLGTTKEGYVIYGLDHSFHKCEMNFRKKINDGLIAKHFKEVEHFTIPNNWNEHYIYSYRKSSPEAKAILAEKKEKIKTVALSKLL